MTTTTREETGANRGRKTDTREIPTNEIGAAIGTEKENETGRGIEIGKGVERGVGREGETGIQSP